MTCKEWEAAWAGYMAALIADDAVWNNAAHTRKAAMGSKLRVSKAYRRLWRMDPEWANRVLVIA